MDIPKTAVITRFGLFKFLRTPFGLANAAQAFQRLMNTVLCGLDCVFIYLDDILVASSSPDQHLWDLTAIFDGLEQHGHKSPLEPSYESISCIGPRRQIL